MAQAGHRARSPGWPRWFLHERDRPESIRRRSDAHWLVVATVCVGAFMGQLDASIVTVAFPTLQRHFRTSLGAVEWVALAYLLVLVVSVTAVGRFADMVGRKLLYTYGFVVFTGASALCGAAPNLAALDAFRVLQGLGAAMLQANSVALITAAMPRAQLGRGIGVQGAAQALGLAMGPTIGGLLLSAGGWRLIFFVNVPVGVIGILLARLLLPRSGQLGARVPFDWWGLAAFAPAVAGLLLALSLGRQAGFDSPGIIALLLLAGAAAAVFVARERRAGSPMVDLGLFRRVPFSAGIATGFLSYAVLFGVLFVVPFLFENALRLSPGDAGLALTVLPAALGVTAPLAGRLADTVGARPLTVAGMLLVAAGLALAAVFHGSLAAVLPELALLGIGLGSFTPPNNASIMSSAPRVQAGVAGGLLNMTRGLGTAVGVAVTGLAFAVTTGTAADTAAAFTRAAWLLAALAGLAALLSVLRGAPAHRAPPPRPDASRRPAASPP